MTKPKCANIFIGYDDRERVAVNVLTNSIQANSSIPVQIGQIRLEQIEDIYSRSHDPLQSTDFSFSRFLVPYLMNYQGWALFIDADMLCLGDISELWGMRDHQKAVQVVKHKHNCKPGKKFQGMPQTPYKRKNWSSVMLFQCNKCQMLSPEFVNTATGLQLHQFNWINDSEIGELPEEWNVLVDVQSIPPKPKILHYTLGGPWFNDFHHNAAGDVWLSGLKDLNYPFNHSSLSTTDNLKSNENN